MEQESIKLNDGSAIAAVRPWWMPRRRFSTAELLADGIVHGVGIVASLAVGVVALVLVIAKTAPDEAPALLVYVISLVTLFSVSMAYNLWPTLSPLKNWLARLDQAAIFLLIAGTYTPFLAVLGHGPTGLLMMVFVWGASLVGIALKLIVPQRFGRLAIFLYLAIGWSGVVVFQQLGASLPPVTLWLLLAGGIVYSLGIVFHLWERLRFQNVLWHVFVVVAAMLHLAAVFDCMVVSRL